MSFDFAVHNQFPLGLTAIFLVVVILASLETGFRTGQRAGNRDAAIRESRDIAMGSMLALLGLLMLVFIAAASVTVAGYNAGLSGSLNRWRMTAFTLVLAAVLSIIIDFDVPQRGFISISQNSMVYLIHDMEAALEDPASKSSPVPRSVQ